jgi:cytoskeletal protein RodZ
MRARIDVSEIEAQTKIRAKYLRALENEEWGLLPGPTFVKSFLRTYATALGLDGKALVEEYRLHHEHPSEGMLEPIVSSPQRNRSRSRPSRGGGSPSDRGSRAYAIAVGTILVIILVLIVLLIAGGKSNKSSGGTSASSSSKSGTAKHHKGASGATAAHATSDVATLSLTPTATVYVCLLGDGGRKLIPGIELQPGATTPTYHARRFEITLGNNAVTMVLDGTARTVPASSRAIGYSITKGGGRRPLQPGQQPTCA